MESLGEGILILPSYPMRSMSNDNFYPFRQQSDLLYFTGYEFPDSSAILTNNEDEEVKSFLFIQNRDEMQEKYDGLRLSLEEASKLFYADEFHYQSEFLQILNSLLLTTEKVFYLDGNNSDQDRLVYNSIRDAKKNKTRKGRGPAFVIDPSYEIHSIRVVKQEEEVNLLRKAAEITADAIYSVIEKTQPGLMEYQIQSEIEHHFLHRGAKGPAYSSICASGKNAVTLHYIDNRDQLSDGEMLLVDAGANYKNYSADITRTWPTNGRFNDTQKRLYSLVLSVQKECIKMVQPNVYFKDIANKSEELLVQGLIKLELLEGEISEIINQGTHKRFVRHGLGHWVGLDVHDTSYFPIMEEKLPVGAYLTIEPGIYIGDEDDIPNDFRNIGIRIEDDVLVTKTGNEILTRGVPKEIDEIEKLMNKH